MLEIRAGQIFPTDHIDQEVDIDVDYSIPYAERVIAALAASGTATTIEASTHLAAEQSESRE